MENQTNNGTFDMLLQRLFQWNLEEQSLSCEATEPTPTFEFSGPLPEQDKVQAHYLAEPRMKLPLQWSGQPLNDDSPLVIESQGLMGSTQLRIDVWISLRNTSNESVSVEGRVLFFGRQGEKVGPRTYWKTLTVPPKASAIFIQSSNTGAVASAEVGFR